MNKNILIIIMAMLLLVSGVTIIFLVTDKDVDTVRDTIEINDVDSENISNEVAEEKVEKEEEKNREPQTIVIPYSINEEHQLVLEYEPGHTFDVEIGDTIEVVNTGEAFGDNAEPEELFKFFYSDVFELDTKRITSLKWVVVVVDDNEEKGDIAIGAVADDGFTTYYFNINKNPDKKSMRGKFDIPPDYYTQPIDYFMFGPDYDFIPDMGQPGITFNMKEGDLIKLVLMDNPDEKMAETKNKTGIKTLTLVGGLEEIESDTEGETYIRVTSKYLEGEIRILTVGGDLVSYFVKPKGATPVNIKEFSINPGAYLGETITLMPLSVFSTDDYREAITFFKYSGIKKNPHDYDYPEIIGHYTDDTIFVNPRSSSPQYKIAGTVRKYSNANKYYIELEYVERNK